MSSSSSGGGFVIPLCSMRDTTGSMDAMDPLQRQSVVWKWSKQDSTHRTAWTTSRIIAPLESSIFSMPGSPSARVGPRFSIRTGFFSSSACLRSLQDVNTTLSTIDYLLYLNAENVARVVPTRKSLSQDSMSSNL